MILKFFAFTPLEIIPRCSTVGLHFRIILAGFNCPAGISNGVNLHLKYEPFSLLLHKFIITNRFITKSASKIFGSVLAWFIISQKETLNRVQGNRTLLFMMFLKIFAPGPVAEEDGDHDEEVKEGD